MDNFKKTIKEIRETLGKMEVALGSINEAIVWTDEKGSIQWCNTLFDRLVSQPHIQVLGKNLIDLLPLRKKSKHLSVEQHPLSICFKNQQNVTEIYEFDHKDGTHILNITMIRIVFKNEKNTYVVISIQDITKRIEHENVLIKQKEELTNINTELSAFQETAIGREEKIIELKKEINELTKKIGKEPPYDLSFIEKV
jgi:PAS domain S-box-containing protein